MAGSAMPTTVASRAAMPEPSTVVVTTHRPRALDSRRPGLVGCAATASLMSPSPGKPSDQAVPYAPSPFGMITT